MKMLPNGFRRTMPTRPALATLLLLSAATARPQSPPPGSDAGPRPGATPPPITFGVEVSYVEVDAIVTDKDGNPVHGLTREDFEIKEDGKPQRVELAAPVEIPITRREPLQRPAPEPDVRTNQQPFEGRLYLIVLDDLHTAALRSQGVRQAARRFVEQYFGDQDLAAVVYTSGRGDASQELTGSRRLLLASIDKFIGRRLRSSTLNRLDDFLLRREQFEPNERPNDVDAFERGHNARIALDTLKGVADWLGNIRGRRKALLYISEGIDYDVTDPFNNKDAGVVLDGMRELVRAATRGNVSIYSVDPRGLHVMSDESMELVPVEDPSLRLDQRGLQDEQRLAQDSLRVLAEETVGRAAVDSNDFATAFERIVQDNSSYYVLGYRPSDQRPGRVHKLEVKVTRPGLTVRARRGYVAGRPPKPEPPSWPGGKSSADLRGLMARPMQQSGLPLSVQAAAFRGDAGNAAVMVTVQVGGSGFRLVEKDGRFRDTLELNVGAVDDKGKFHGSGNQIQLELKPETKPLVEAAGFRSVSQLDLPPGRYQLRVAARTANAPALGSVYADLEVPDFSKPPLVISGVAVASAGAARIPTGGGFAPLKELLPAQPTTAREFSTLDTLALVAEIYDNELKTPHTVDVSTRVQADDGSVKFRNDQERKTEELVSVGGGTFVHRIQIPLKEIPPGSYTLRVEARSRIAKTPAVGREIPIRIVAAPARGPS